MMEERPQEKASSEDDERTNRCFFAWLSILAIIGGFLFGYDTGVISGAMILIKDDFTVTDSTQELIVSVTVGAAAIFALVGAFLNDRFGRKKVILTSSLIFSIGAVEMALAANVTELIIGRFIVGAGIGLSSMTVPMYLAEVAPSKHRGTLLTVSNLFLTFGQFLASVIDGAFSYVDKGGWRYMLGLAAIPAIIRLVGFVFMPESPRWLIEHKKYDQAREALIKIGHTERAADKEFDAIQASCIQAENERKLNGGQWVLITMVSTPRFLRALIVGCALQMFQQVTGINTVMYYSATIIEMAGIKNKHTVIWLSAATASVNFLATFIGIYFVEKIGRRLLTLISLLGVAFSLLLLGVTFQVMATNSPAISLYNSTNSSPCSRVSSCQSCITYRSDDAHCGYCFFDDQKADKNNGACLPYSSDDSRMSLSGLCHKNISESESLTWTTNWCPTDLSWLIVVGLVLYLIFFASGMGPMPWTINAEIYPQWARSTGNGVATAVNWVFNLAISMSFLSLMTAITRQGAYYLYSALAFVALVFFWWVLPETKGLSLEQVEHLFSRRWCGPRPSRPVDEPEEKLDPYQTVVRVNY